MSEFPECAISSLVVADRPITYGIVQPGPDISPEGIPLIRGKDYSSGKVDGTNLYHVLPEIDRPYARSKVRGGDILLSIVGYVGKVAIVPDELDGANITQTTARISIDENKANNEFIFQFLSSPHFGSEIRRYEKGSAQPGLNLADVEKLRVRKPSLPHQRRIAEILTTLDEAIEQAEALIAKHQQIKAGLMHDLFTRGITPDGHLRPTRGQAPDLYKESPLGWIPKEWEVRPFHSVLAGNLQNGYFKKPELVGTGYKLVNVSELYQPFGIDTDQPNVERVAATSTDFYKFGVQEGDLFFTRSSLVLSGIAQCNTVLKLIEPTLFECHVIRGQPDKNIVNPEFLGLYFQIAWARRELMSRAKQTTMTTISQPDIVSVPVLRPTLAACRT